MRNDIIELKNKTKLEYEDKLKELEADYKKKIDAIDLVFSMIEKENHEPQKIVRIKSQEDVSESAIATSQVVREIIGRLNGEFSAHDIKREASAMTPPLRVSRNVLHGVFKMKKENGEVEVVVEGAGRAPAIYKKTDKYVSQ